MVQGADILTANLGLRPSRQIWASGPEQITKVVTTGCHGAGGAVETGTPGPRSSLRVNLKPLSIFNSRLTTGTPDQWKEGQTVKRDK